MLAFALRVFLTRPSGRAAATLRRRMLGRGVSMWRRATADRRGRKARARLGERFRECGRAMNVAHVLEVWWGASCKSPAESMRMARLAGRALVKVEIEVRVWGLGLVRARGSTGDCEYVFDFGIDEVRVEGRGFGGLGFAGLTSSGYMTTLADQASKAPKPSPL